MLFSSLENPKAMELVEAEDVAWNDAGDGDGTGHGDEDGAPSGSSLRELLIFN